MCLSELHIYIPQIATARMNPEIARFLVAAPLLLRATAPTRPISKVVKGAATPVKKSHKPPRRASAKFMKETARVGSESPAPISISPIIAKTRADAIQMDKEDKNDIKIYTDASGRNGEIGAAAVLYYGHIPPEIARYYLGKGTKYSVFEGECLGQLLGFRLLERKMKTLGTGNLRATFAVDNQDSLTCHEMKNRYKKPRSPIIQEIHNAHSKIIGTYPNLRIDFRWVPSHVGITGGNEADKQARESTKGAKANTLRQDQVFESEMLAAEEGGFKLRFNVTC